MVSRRSFMALLLAGAWPVRTATARTLQASQTFKARLSPVPRDGSMRATVTGLGAATATLTGRTLSITGSFDGLSGPATIARLHRGRARGVRGPVIHELTVTAATNGSVSGTVELSTEQLDSLNKGSIYIQIHSEKAPEGNLWGWLLQ